MEGQVFVSIPRKLVLLPNMDRAEDNELTNKPPFGVFFGLQAFQFFRSFNEFFLVDIVDEDRM
jgi:hypothetical protein